MNSVMNIPVDDLKRRRDVRPLNNDAVTALADSIGTIGLVNPIRVRKIDDGFEVIAGSHRFAACTSLDWREVPCLVVDDDDLHAELAMIDENLCRAELSPADRAKQTARRKAIYLELHPETRVGENQHTRVRQVGEGSGNADRFTAETAAATGKSERVVQRDAERGEKVIDEVIDLIRGTKLDTGVYLDKLKKLAPNEQVIAAKRALVADRREEKAKAQAEREAKQAENDAFRDANRAALPEDIQRQEAAKQSAIAAHKAQPADDGLTDADRIAELEQANAFLEGRVAELETQIKTYDRLELMYRDWADGGWERVVQAKDDTIAELQRTAQARIAMESGEKVRNLKAMRGLAKKLDEAGKGRDIYIDLDEPTNG